MTTPTVPARTRGEKFEGFVQVLILLTIGTVAAAASFTHVHNVAAAHGQPGWLAWADAVTLELMSIATGLEIRRRARAGRQAGFVAWVLVSAVALSLAAQVVEAEPSVIGWIAAALPAFGFLACVKIVMTRTVATAPEPSGTPVPEPVPAVPLADFTVDGDRSGVPVQVTEPAPESALLDLLDRARTEADAHREATGRDITRDELRERLRVRAETASALLQLLRVAGTINGNHAALIGQVTR